MKHVTGLGRAHNPSRQTSAFRLRGVALGVFLAGMSIVGSASAASTVQVVIENFGFSQANITVAKGTTVEWINHDPTPHSVVSDKPLFDSGLLGVDDSFKFTFNEPGVINYSCGQHARMPGTVTVTGK
jgi:plastocyanin